MELMPLCAGIKKVENYRLRHTIRKHATPPIIIIATVEGSGTGLVPIYIVRESAVAPDPQL